MKKGEKSVGNWLRWNGVAKQNEIRFCICRILHNFRLAISSSCFRWMVFFRSIAGITYNLYRFFFGTLSRITWSMTHSFASHRTEILFSVNLRPIFLIEYLCQSKRDTFFELLTIRFFFRLLTHPLSSLALDLSFHVYRSCISVNIDF